MIDDYPSFVRRLHPDNNIMFMCVSVRVVS